MPKNIRRLTQALFLLIFLWLFLQTQSRGADELGYPVKVFLEADPLIYITTALSTRQFYSPFLLALIVILATVLWAACSAAGSARSERCTTWRAS